MDINNNWLRMWYSCLISILKSPGSWFHSVFRKGQETQPNSESTFNPNSSPTSPNSQTSSVSTLIAQSEKEGFDISITIGPEDPVEACPSHVHGSCTLRGRKMEPSAENSSPGELPVYNRQIPRESRSGDLNPILDLLQGQELAKTVLGFTVPMTTGLLSMQSQDSASLPSHVILLLFSVGFAALWNGILLRKMLPKFATAVEQFGLVCAFVAFFGVMGSFLPPSLVWASWACFVLSVLPLALSYLPT